MRWIGLAHKAEMKPLTIYELRSRANEHFEAVRRTPGIDHFCSSLDWLLPAHEAFWPDQPLLLFEAESGGFVTLSRGFNPRTGRFLQPLEASWCLASPIVGESIVDVVEEFALEFIVRADWELLYLSGIPTNSPAHNALISSFAPTSQIGLGQKTRRYVGSLEGGFESYLARRSPKFRANMRRSRRRAEEANVEYEYLSSVEDAEVEDLYERILAVEERSWKGMDGTGILDGGMNVFYRRMLPRLARRDALRVLFASADGQDIAFVFGGLFDDIYRGLQLSYDEDHRSLSPGNLVQYAIIEQLCAEGIAHYDLGSELEYKARWGSGGLETTTLWIWRKH